MHPLRQRVEVAFAQWREKRQNLQDASRALEQALDAYTHGAGPEPTHLKTKVEELRQECDRLFGEVLAAVAAAKDAAVR